LTPREGRIVPFRATADDLEAISRLITAGVAESTSDCLRMGLRLALRELGSRGQASGKERDMAMLLVTPREAAVAVLESAFIRELGEIPLQRFGSDAIGHAGFSDGNAGAQWNAWVGRSSGEADETAYLGANIEGLKYAGWPIADIALQETRDPRVFSAIARVPRPESITAIWWMDAWQGRIRLRTFREQILLPETPLSELTSEAWTSAAQKALECLDEKRGYRGRGRQTITLKDGRREEYEVSPHFQFRKKLWEGAPPLPDEAYARVHEAREQMQPLYDFIRSSSNT
jgi:Arc/MetJ-type ribon-helix-helix transcriptional regulator